MAGVTAPSVAPEVMSDVWAAVEPLRMAVHAKANQHPHGSDARAALLHLATNITVAGMALNQAVTAAEDALPVAPR